MVTMDVPLSEAMKEWVDAQTKSGRYDDAGDYMRDLIRRDQERANKLAELQRLLTEGLESGESDRSGEQIIEAARARYAAPRS